MKIFEAMEAKRGGQVAPRTRFAHLEAKYSVAPAPRDIPDHFQWRYSIHLHCNFVGPRDASEHYAKHARRLIAQEVYGEICTDLMELTRLLMEESYRGDGDPVLEAIENMRRKMRGDS